MANGLFPKDAFNQCDTHQHIYSKEMMLGLMNYKVIPSNLQNLWPFWVYKQLLPDSPQFIPSGYPPFLLNTSNRNWTTLSCPLSKATPIIDPKGLITPLHHGWSLDLWIANSQKVISL